MSEKKFVIPEQMFPLAGVNEIDGYLVRNDAMFTAYSHTAGEFSEFFKALRDDCKILGHECPNCHQVICPPFEQLCPQCNFVEMRQITMKDVGIMAASPIIVFFAPARFKSQVPYGTGYVFLSDENRKESDTAIMLRVRTTQGILKPGIFKKDTKVKVVFRNERQGEMMDIFAVSQAELTPEQIAKTPLMESDLNWNNPKEPSFGEPTEEIISAFDRALEGFKILAVRVKRSERAQKDLANWERKVNIKTRGGAFGLLIKDSYLLVLDSEIINPDLILAVEDPALFLPWLERGSALTNLVMEGTLWINKSELETITRLDRLPRSLRRDNC